MKMKINITFQKEGKINIKNRNNKTPKYISIIKLYNIFSIATKKKKNILFYRNLK